MPRNITVNKDRRKNLAGLFPKSHSDVLVEANQEQFHEFLRSNNIVKGVRHVTYVTPDKNSYIVYEDHITNLMWQAYLLGKGAASVKYLTDLRLMKFPFHEKQDNIIWSLTIFKDSPGCSTSFYGASAEYVLHEAIKYFGI